MESLPRLADALAEVGTRLGEISAELHALHTTADTGGAASALGQPGAAATPPTGTPTAGVPGRPGDHPTGAIPPAAGPTSTQWHGAAAQPGAGHSAEPPPSSATDQPGATQPAGQPPGEHAQAAGPVGTPTGATQSAGAPGQPGSGRPAGHQPIGAGFPPGVIPSAAFATHPGAAGWPRGGHQSHQPPPPPHVPTQQPPVWYPPPAPPPEPGPTLWERLSRDGAGSRILAWAGGVVTLAGVMLLLILAIQRGYLGPLPRVLLGAGLGLVLAGIGALLHRSPTARTGAYALTATGIAVLYLDVLAATSLYDFLPQWGGLAAALAVTAGGIALAGAWDSELLAVFVVVCSAASAPVITQGFDALLLSFLLVLLLGTTPVQLVKRWSGLAVAAGTPPVVVCLVNVALAMTHRFDEDAATTAILAGVTSAIVIVLATATAIRRPDDEFTILMLFLAPVPGLLAAILLPRVGAAILPAAIGVLLLGVWVMRDTLPKAFGLSAGGIAALAFTQATATAFDGDARAIAFLAEALIVTLLAVRLRLSAALLPAALFGAVGLVLGLVFAARPDLVVRPPHWRLDTGAIVSLGLTGAMLAATAITLCWAVYRLTDGEHTPHGWVAAGLLALYGMAATLLSAGLLVSPDRDGFLLGHVLVTVSWTLGALVLLLRGIDSVPLRVAGLSLVVAALAKLVLFDLSSLDGLARVAAFLVAGLVLLGAGARYAKLVASRP